MNWLITMGYLWESPEMGSTSKDTMPRSSSIESCVNIVYSLLCVSIFETLCLLCDLKCVFHKTLLMHIFFSDGQMTSYIGFADGAH